MRQHFASRGGSNTEMATAAGAATDVAPLPVDVQQEGMAFAAATAQSATAPAGIRGWWEHLGHLSGGTAKMPQGAEVARVAQFPSLVRGFLKLFASAAVDRHGGGCGMEEGVGMARASATVRLICRRRSHLRVAPSCMTSVGEKPVGGRHVGEAWRLRWDRERISAA